MSASLADRLRSRLVDEGLAPGSWSNGPGDVYGAHAHDYDKVLVCARGSIAFGAGGWRVELREGDRLELPAGTRHDAQVGSGGVACLEAHLPAGRLPEVRYRLAGEW